jgi:MOSC domain-containing protein YiiM
MIESIYIARQKGEALRQIPSARIVVDRGLEGDRYFDCQGSFSKWPGGGRAVTLIAVEAIEAIAAEHGFDLSDGKHRRNLVTRGVNLDALVNKCFAINDVILIGNRLCAPCKYLERLIAPGLYEAIKGRGGLRADVLRSGEIKQGDGLQILPSRPPGI